MKPTEDLKKEHEDIKLMLRVLEEVSKRLEAGGTVSAQDLDSSLEFIRVFADKCHHGKEEGLLFPAMEKAGVPREGGPIEVMLREHKAGRELVKRMGQALETYKKGGTAGGREIAGNARSYAALLSQHIAKEDTILYPMADARLSAASQRELEEGFERIEQEVIGPGKHEEFHRLLHRLKDEYLSKP